MRLQLLYVHDEHIGYGRYGSRLAAGLRAQGVTVVDSIAEGESNPANVACWVSVPTHARGWHNGQRLVISTMWEATRLPEAFRETLHHFDQVIVPSRQNLELFSQYHPNVARVPLGVDPQEWAFRERIPPSDRFVFLIGGSGPRKGVDLAVAAFRKVFATWPADMPRPTLIVKSPKRPDVYGDNIEVVTGHIPADRERDLYGMAHCYLQPSRGEGFGLQPLQAIAQGCPTILTDAHGHAEFAHLGYGIPAREQKAGYFAFGDGGDWWEPDLDALCERMEYVYYNWDAARDFAAMASEVALREFTWERCATNFLRAIGHKHLDRAYSGDGTWRVPQGQLFEVQVTKRWRAEIAGTVYQWQPGETTWEPADVKRILFDAGLLDPACLHDMPGLLPDQVKAQGGVSGSEAWCYECGQQLGSGIRHEPAL